MPEQETWAPQSEDSVLSASATCSTQLCLASQSLGASGAASVKWPLKPTSGVTVASNVSTKTAESVLQLRAVFMAPGSLTRWRSMCLGLRQAGVGLA